MSGDVNIKLCCSTRRINDPSVRCSDVTSSSGNQECSPTKYFFSNDCRDTRTFASGERSVERVNVKLQAGQTNFDSYTGPSDFTNVFEKCPVESMSDLNSKKVCLLHVNNNPKELCPSGWKYNGKFDTEKYDNKNINICCRNL